MFTVFTRILSVPSADRIDTGRLLSVLGIPLAAGIAMASAVAATGGSTDPIAEAGGAYAFVLEFVKFCYLAVAMAHLSGALVERTNGGLAAGLWLDDDKPDAEPVDPKQFWHAFPNHVDGTALALAAVVVCLIAG